MWRVKEDRHLIGERTLARSGWTDNYYFAWEDGGHVMKYSK